MKILIIGCGYVGLALVSALKSLPAEVSATTRSSSRVEELSKVVTNVHEVPTPSKISAIISDYDVIIFTVGADSRNSYESAYLDNAKAIVAGLKESNKEQQIIYTSTTSVYGDHNGGWVDEETELQPLTEQAKILVETEKTLLAAKSPKKKVCIFRLGGIVGPGRSIEERVVKNAGGTFPGDGMSYSNLSPRDTVVDGIRFAVENHLDGVYNLCSDEHLRRKDMYDKICEEHGLAPITWDSSKPSIHGGNKRVSSEKFKSLQQVLLR